MLTSSIIAAAAAAAFLSAFYPDFRHSLHLSAWFYFHLMLNDDSRLSSVERCMPNAYALVCNSLDLKTQAHTDGIGMASASFSSAGLPLLPVIHTIIFYSIEKQTILSVMKQNYVFNRIW